VNRIRKTTPALVVAGATALTLLAPASATEATPSLWKNCTHVHSRYRHGVGRANAHDHTSGTPVTNFYRSSRVYKIAMRWNRGLDRDRDGIACEQG
jgi:hypothetical protein